MTKGVETIFTFDQFKHCIERTLEMAKREEYLRLATGAYIENSAIDDYISLLSSLFPMNENNYPNHYMFWKSWNEMVECAIVSFIYGVADYEKGTIIGPKAHELLSLDSLKDPYNRDDEEYIVPINSVKDLWKICTGEIRVRERFS